MTPFGQLDTYQSTAVLTSSPGRIVLLLLDRAVRHLESARLGFDIEDPADRFTSIGGHLGRSLDILRELRRSLNQAEGGELADRLESLYHFLEDRIFEASLRKDKEILEHSTGLLSGLRDSWREMLVNQPTPLVPPLPTRTLDSAGFDVRT